jgi:hypothetical protein
MKRSLLPIGLGLLLLGACVGGGYMAFRANPIDLAFFQAGDTVGKEPESMKIASDFALRSVHGQPLTDEDVALLVSISKSSVGSTQSDAIYSLGYVQKTQRSYNIALAEVERLADLKVIDHYQTMLLSLARLKSEKLKSYAAMLQKGDDPLAQRLAAKYIENPAFMTTPPGSESRIPARTSVSEAPPKKS